MRETNGNARKTKKQEVRTWMTGNDRNLNNRAMLNNLRRTIRRPELRQIVPLADTTIYEMEQRGEFPRRFNLTARCVVWYLAEVEAWIEQRRRDSRTGTVKQAPAPDVRRRKTRPVKESDTHSKNSDLL